AAASGLFVLMPMVGSRLVEGVIGGGGFADLAVNLLIGLAIFFAATLITYGRTYLMTRLSFLITADLRSRMFARLLKVQPRRLAGAGGGQLLSSFSNDLAIFQDALTRVIAIFAPSVLQAIIFAAAMAWYSWLLFVCTIVLVSPLILVTSYF